MNKFVLYCKSYSTDVRRAVRLAETVRKFNVDKIPFYISTPKVDIPLFEEYLKNFNVELIADEDIVKANRKIDADELGRLPGRISQQIIKSEFWRLDFCESYICLDSDCIFIRPFHKSEFITESGAPYTIMDEGRDILFPALSQNKIRVIDDFLRESRELQNEFSRPGKIYNFGPNSPVWHRKVWESLDENILRPTQQSFLDLINKWPNEMRWYGESLLKYKAIEILPSQPFFKMYHYAWQLKNDRKNGIDTEQLAQLYCGVVLQSAWEREMDWPSEGGSWLSRGARRLRRSLGHS
jgi:hypothetical protein